MQAQRKHFISEFKQAAVRRIASGDVTALDGEREPGIRSEPLREWIARARRNRPRPRPAGGECGATGWLSLAERGPVIQVIKGSAPGGNFLGELRTGPS